MHTPYTYKLKLDSQNHIIEKTETVAGKTIIWTYAYDKEGRLTAAHLNNQLVCQCDFDRDSRRIRDRFPLTAGNSYRNYEYNLMTGRLMRTGDSRFTHDEAGFRSIRNDRGRYTTYDYAPDYRLLSAHQEDEDIRYTFKHDENGQRIAKFRNGQLAEAYLWLDLIRLAGFHDGQDAYEFLYREGDRLPAAMLSADGGVALLFYDQVGSLHVAADRSGNVIKEILYDPFGGILEDTNPALQIPLGFAGGLHDHDLGLIRFGWRDYDPTTGRWTAPDPMGDAGGDPDWYGYCLDDPVNLVDPLGLAYRGNDFGPGYDGTSGSSYGPTASGGWGYKDSSLNEGNGGSKDSGNKTGDNVSGNSDKNTNSARNWTDFEVPTQPDEQKQKTVEPDEDTQIDAAYEEDKKRLQGVTAHQQKMAELAQQAAMTMALSTPKGEEEPVEQQEETKGTTSKGVQLSGSLPGVGGSVGAAIVEDKKNMGLELSVSYGLNSLPGLSLNLTGQTTNAPDIDSLAGTSYKTGMEAVAPGVSGGAGFVQGDGYHGVDVTVGTGAKMIGPNAYAHKEVSIVIDELQDIINLFK